MPATANASNRTLTELPIANGALVFRLVTVPNSRAIKVRFTHPHTKKAKVVSTGKTTLPDARAWAEDFGRELITRLYGAMPPDQRGRETDGLQMTHREVFDQYRARRLPQIDPATRPNFEAAMRYWEAVVGRSLRIIDNCKATAQEYFAKRQRGGFEYERPNGDIGVAGPVTEHTALEELKRVRTILNWMTEQPLQDGTGRKKLAFNPMNGRDYMPTVETEQRAVVAPDNIRERLLGVADEVEATYMQSYRYAAYRQRPNGWLRALFVTELDTGRRGKSLSGLRVRDVITTEDEFMQVAGMFALGTPFWKAARSGCVLFWQRAFDKKGRDRISYAPFRVAEVLVPYAQSVYEMTGDRDALLFPSPTTPSRPCDQTQRWRWFVRLEAAAGLAHVKGGAVHSLRRKWRTDRRWLPDKLVALVGGWATWGGQDHAVNKSYLQFPAEDQFKCAEYWPERDGSPSGGDELGGVTIKAPDRFPRDEGGTPPLRKVA